MSQKSQTSSRATSVTPVKGDEGMDVPLQDEACDDENQQDIIDVKVRFKQLRSPSFQKALGGSVGGEGDELDSWLKSKQLLRPDDQMDLSEADLAEEIPKILTSENKNAPQNLVIYSFRDGGFVPVPKESNVVTLFEFEGTALHIESAEAKAQLARDAEAGIDSKTPEGPRVEKATETVDIEKKEPIGDEDGDGEDGEGSDGGGDGEAADVDDDAQELAVGAVGGPKKKLTNQFNFCERAALTYNNPSRSVETQTVPPPRSSFSANVVQWNIYDSYNEDYERIKREKEREAMKDKKPGLQKQVELKRTDGKNKALEEYNKRYFQKCQVLERMVNQNIFDEIAHDYRYWEDPSDEFRDDEGTLLPLWKFGYEKTKKMSVTEICFNTYYYDLFAVCFGSFEFTKQVSEGYVCLFSIKNPSFPEYRITTESGAMCCDIHPKYPYLIVIGLYDGNVCVYNLQVGAKEPVYISQGVNGKHSEPVWEIKWGPDMQDGEINFYSLSSDGKVFNWVLMQNKLTLTTIITLYLDINPVSGPDGTMIKLKGSGTCMVFHPENPEIFQVGTEEGQIFKCSTAYSSKYLMIYQAHYLSVHRMDFNKFNSNIFISCSGDWRVKIWEDMRSDPLFIFDLGASVGDVKWAPYSSTVFAAVTSEGKVFVFDLNINKYRAICVQQVVPRRKNKLTRITFNYKLPFIIVGDDKGTSITLKLSPNLRQKCKPPKKQQWLDQQTLQLQKLDRLLSLVRELPEGKPEAENADENDVETE